MEKEIKCIFLRIVLCMLGCMKWENREQCEVNYVIRSLGRIIKGRIVSMEAKRRLRNIVSKTDVEEGTTVENMYGGNE